MTSDCHLVLQIRLRKMVVTRVEPRGGLRTGHAELLDADYTVEALADLLDVSVKTAHNLLSLHRDALGPPAYRQRRTRGDFRLRRVLVPADVRALALRICPEPVKP